MTYGALLDLPAGSPGERTKEQGKSHGSCEGSQRRTRLGSGDTLLNSFMITAESPGGHLSARNPPEPVPNVGAPAEAYGSPRVCFFHVDCLPLSQLSSRIRL